MAKINSSKAVFFSLVSIFVIILFVIAAELNSKFVIKESELEITRTRVKILNSIIKDIETTYFDRILYVSSKNALIGLSKYYTEDYDRIEKELSLALQDTIYNGVLTYTYKSPVNLTQGDYIDEEYTIVGLAGKISSIFDKIGIDVEEFKIVIPNSGVKQTDPWHIQITADIDYFFKDKNNIASWKGEIEKTINVTVYGMYAYDCVQVPCTKENRGIITNKWRVDRSPVYTEPTLIDKLGKTNPTVSGTRGLCSLNFDCRNDGQSPQNQNQPQQENTQDETPANCGDDC